MNEQEMDRGLTQLFQEELRLPSEVAGTLRRRFEIRRAEEEQRAWMAFTVVMVQLNGRMRAALEWRRWRAYGLIRLEKEPGR